MKNKKSGEKKRRVGGGWNGVGGGKTDGDEGKSR